MGRPGILPSLFTCCHSAGETPAGPTAKMAVLRTSRKHLRSLRRRSRSQTSSGRSLILRSAEPEKREKNHA